MNDSSTALPGELQKLPGLLFAWRFKHALSGASYAILPTLAGAGVTAGFIGSPIWFAYGAAAALLLAVVGWVYAGRRFAHYRAQIRNGEGVVLYSGVIWRSEAWVPISRLQHIDVSQGPLDRRWGMASLTLHTAGTHDHATRIEGLPVEQAHALRAALLPRVRGEHD